MISFILNGQAREYSGDPERPLLRYLRDVEGILSPKDGCSGQGFCGACLVEVDGGPILSCSFPMKRLAGKTVTTIEGFPEPLKQLLARSFVTKGAVQCGFCTPGFLTRTKLLLQKNAQPTRAEIVQALKFNLCRCTGYHSIVDAVEEAARELNGARPVSPATEHGIGDPHPKYLGQEMARGEFRFVSDLTRPDMVFGALRFADHPRARVVRLDTRKAQAAPGVVRVFTAADVPGERFTGQVTHDWPLMIAVGETTRTVADVLCAVAAETEDQARAAIALVEVEYEVLPPLLDVQQAGSSPIHVHPDRDNLLETTVYRRGGDVGALLAESAHVARGTFQTQRIEHAFLETEAALAQPRNEGVELHTQGQGAYEDRRQIARLLGLPEGKVRVIGYPTGGGFGGKEDITVQGHACLMSFLLGRPVKVRLTRPESIRMHPKRHPVTLEYEVGCDRQGKLTALRARIVGDTGAYASVGGKVIERTAGHATGAYHLPAVDIEARTIYTNNLPCGAMRGFGVNQATFAIEACLDMLCEQGGFDRWQFRYDNALTGGSMTASGQALQGGVGVRACLEALKPFYLANPKAGLACGIKNTGIGNGVTDESRTLIEVAAGDHLIIHHGWTEMGQGLNTVAIQSVVEETGLDPERVRFTVTVDTDREARSGMTTASRGTTLLASSLRDACRELKRDLTGKSLPDLVGKSYRGHWKCDWTTAPGAKTDRPVTHYSYGYAAQLAVLDPQGQVTRVYAAHDAGRILNPTLFKGQIQGSVHMGLGYALSEELELVDGAPRSGKMRDLGLLPMDRTPEVEVIGIEVTDPVGPFGAKGVGEIGLVPTAAAVANARALLTGVRPTRLPLDRKNRP